MPGIDLNYFIRQANKLSEKIEERKKELAELTMEGKAGDGRVVAVVTALAQSRHQMQAELAKISGGIKIPGIT